MERITVGIEIGGTKQQIAVATNGKIIEKMDVRLEDKTNAENILDWIKTNLYQLSKHYIIAGIGVGFGGPINPISGQIVCSCQVEGWENFNLKQWFEDSFHCPVEVRNDTVCGGIGEYFKGAGQGARRLFYTNIGTGIGGMLMDENGYHAASFGYLWVPDWTANNRLTRLEFLCSGPSIEKRLNSDAYVPHSSVLYPLVGHIRCMDFSKAVEDGDIFALEELERICNVYAYALSDCLALSYADKVVIGGGVAKIGAPLFDRIKQKCDQCCFIENRGCYDIFESALADDAVLIGALLLIEEPLKHYSVY